MSITNGFSMAGINGRECISSVFLSKDEKKILTPQNASFSRKVGENELTVTYKVGRKLNAIRDERFVHSHYDPAIAVDHILSPDEVVDRDDHNRTSDAFLYAEPELDTTKLAPLDDDSVQERFAWFVMVCNRVAEEAMLSLILESAPKKKNGAFAKNKITVVAAIPYVTGSYLSYYEIVGKPKNDFLLEVTIQERTFSETEWLRTKDNVFLQYLSSGKTETKTVETSKKLRFWHKSEGTKLAVEVPVVALEDGRLAIDAQPYRAISDFRCVEGNDKKGYAIVNPPDFVKEITVNDVPLTVIGEMDLSYNGSRVLWKGLSDYVKYLKEPIKKYRSRAGVFVCVYDDKAPIPQRCLSEHYVAELVYQLLYCLDAAYAALDDPSLLEKGMPKITKKRNGTVEIKGNRDTNLPTAPGRIVPLVKAYFMSSNNDGNIRFVLLFRHAGEDKWSEFEA